MAPIMPHHVIKYNHLIAIFSLFAPGVSKPLGEIFGGWRAISGLFLALFLQVEKNAFVRIYYFKKLKN